MCRHVYQRVIRAFPGSPGNITNRRFPVVRNTCDKGMWQTVFKQWMYGSYLNSSNMIDKMIDSWRTKAGQKWHASSFKPILSWVANWILEVQVHSFLKSTGLKSRFCLGSVVRIPNNIRTVFMVWNMFVCASTTHLTLLEGALFEGEHDDTSWYLMIHHWVLMEFWGIASFLTPGFPQVYHGLGAPGRSGEHRQCLAWCGALARWPLEHWGSGCEIPLLVDDFVFFFF